VDQSVVAGHAEHRFSHDDTPRLRP